MTLSKKVVLDMLLFFSLTVSIYFFRTLRSISSKNSTSNSHTSKSREKLQKLFKESIELLERLLLYARDREQCSHLELFYQEAIGLQKEYDSVSPSLILLGPIGAAAKVLQENSIHKKMVTLTQKIIDYQNKNENLSIKIG